MSFLLIALLATLTYLRSRRRAVESLEVSRAIIRARRRDAELSLITLPIRS